jgi:hypothetical protein
VAGAVVLTMIIGLTTGGDDSGNNGTANQRRQGRARQAQDHRHIDHDTKPIKTIDAMQQRGPASIPSKRSQRLKKPASSSG